MCDFHDFGLAWKCQKMGFGWLHDYLKGYNQRFLKFFLHSDGPFHSKSFSKTFILAFEANMKMRPKLWKSHIMQTELARSDDMSNGFVLDFLARYVYSQMIETGHYVGHHVNIIM